MSDSKRLHAVVGVVAWLAMSCGGRIAGDGASDGDPTADSASDVGRSEVGQPETTADIVTDLGVPACHDTTPSGPACSGDPPCEFGPTLGFGAELMREGSAGLEGQRFHVKRSGDLVRIEAAVWGGSLARVDLYLVCGATKVKVATANSDAVPPYYDGIRSPNVLTSFTLAAPVHVLTGDVLDVMIAASVEGIHEENVDPDSEIVFYNDHPGLPAYVDWDLVARIHFR